MKFGVLGPVTVEPGDSGVGGERQRRLLAALLLERGHVVPTDRLAEIVFAGNPTDAAAVTMRSYVARLRKAIDGSDAVISTKAPGYVLDVGSAAVDAERFEQGLRSARSLHSEGQVPEALEELNAALGLWRGPAYVEFADEEWIRSEAIRLDELRAVSRELRLQCLLDLGRHDDAVAEIAAFVERHPLREGARMLLLTALYRSGRHADAVRAATAYRDELAELGLEPAADFDQLEERIVLQDPDLRLPPRPGRALRGYRLGDRLGGSDDVEVQTALQPGIERTVVVTSYAASIADDAVFIREFEAAVRRVARLEHPGLVEIVDFWREPGSAHLVTRFVRGGNLDRLLEKAPLAASTVADLGVQISTALAAAHAEGLWHGQLRPEDVLVDDDGSVRIAGVGTSDVISTIRNEAPPIVVEPGPARDQMALAVLIIRALTGAGPIDPTGGARAFARVSDVRPELLALDGVLARATAAYHGDRYPDITSFARSFADAIGAEPPSARVDRANPYKGLRAFGEGDTEDFFGRETMVGELVGRLAHERLVSVVGASGSGKSSVVRAGVIPRMRRDDWLVATMVPGASPFAELTDALRRVLSLDRAARLDAGIGGVHETLRDACERDPLLLIIDQFEELYTLLTDDTERARFIHGLMDAVEDEELELRVLLTLRADFFDRPLQHHRLGATLADGALAIPAMSPAELERAVVAPAARVGVEIDGAVVTELVADVVDQPAGLPLLQFSLTELFEARNGERITIDDHRRLGGVAGAIAQRAERLYSAATLEEQQLVRLLFLRLVTATSRSADLRRRTDRSELLSASPDSQAMERVIDRFGAARLLTFDRNPTTRQPTVEVAHEALLRHWPRLRDWVEEAGHELELRARLTASAADWEKSSRDPGELYRGARLVAVEDWAERGDLTVAERSFLVASLDRRAEEIEAERSQLEAEIRTNRRLRTALGAVAVVLIVALVAGFLAVDQRNKARDETVRAEQARGRSLAVSAEEQLPVDRSLALLLAVEASSLDQSDATRASLLETLGGDAQPFTRTVIPTPAAGYISLALSPDGSTAIGKRNAGPIDIVDLESRTVTAAGLEAPPSLSAGIDISDDGRLVVVSGDAKATGGTAAIVYSIADASEVLRIERPVVDVPGRDFGYLHQAVFAPGSEEIVMSEPDGVISVLDADSGEVLETVETGAPEIIALDVDQRVAYISYLTFSDTGTTSLLSAWNLDTGEPTAEPTELEGFVVRVVSDAGRVVVSGDASVAVFDSTTLEPVGDPFGDPRGGGAFTGLANSPFGLLAVGSPVDLQVWVTGDGSSPPFKLEIEGQASGVAFAPDVSVLVTADPDGSISTWRMGHVDDLGTPLVPEGPGLVTLSPAGDLVAVWARGRGVQLFERESLEHVAGLEGLGEGDNFLGLAFDPTGDTVAVLTCAVGEDGAFEQTGSCEAGLSLYDTASAEPIAGPVTVGQVDGDIGAGAAFIADGERIVVALATGRVGMYDASDLSPVDARLQLPEISEGPDDWSMAIAVGDREGRDLLAILNSVSLVAVWDITDEPALIGSIDTSSNAIGFTPDGELVVGFVNGPVQIYDPLTVEPVGAPFPSTVPAWSFAQSETGVLVVNGLFGGTRLWDMTTRQPLSGALPGFASGIDPDGSRLFLGALGDGDAGTRVSALPLDLESLVAAACEQAGRNLTIEEWFRYMPADTELRVTCPEWPLADS